ncbi:MAG: protein translocase subunit SecF [Thermoanaerobaculia bacterium]|nr:protein translocase subunit SecF [Thermoanaerobaculia bacterium]
MDFLADTKIDFMKYRKGWIAFSLLLALAGLTEVLVDRLNMGIDFAGGTQLTVKLAEKPRIDALRDAFAEAGIADAQIQRFGDEEDNEVLIKTSVVAGDEEGSRDEIVTILDRFYDQAEGEGIDLNRRGADAVENLLVAEDPDGIGGTPEARRTHYGPIAEAVLDQREIDGLLESWETLESVEGLSAAALDLLRERSELGAFAVLGAEHVGPQIGAELRAKGILAVVMSLIGMLVYIWMRFELRFGIGALIATMHDVAITLGLFAWFGFEFNLTTIAAFLTLVGYSVNDSVVVFDRVRENLRRSRVEPLVDVMNQSLNQMLSRTVLTSGTTLLAVGSLLFLGGDVLRGFSFIMTCGILIGTYSSIYIAAPATEWMDRRFFSKNR